MNYHPPSTRHHPPLLEVVLATRNRYKISEIKEIFAGLPMRFLSLADVSGAPVIAEDGKSFEENAVKKALGIAQWSGKLALADDSGIEVEVLSNDPGIYSARFAGEKATDEENNQKLLDLLKIVPFEKRKARYRCVMAVATPDGATRTAEGTCEGFIAFEPMGENGFGYDPLFFYPPFGITFGQTEPDLKNKVSHRCHALQTIKPVLLELLKL